MVRGGQTYYYHYNAHGDVVALTDSSGASVAEYDYDAWGNPVTTGLEGTVVNHYHYAGHRWDAETGMYYLNARYYLPSVGRFISRDSFHGFEDEPASLNFYVYAYSNPIISIDPDGDNPIVVAALRILVKVGKQIGKQVVKRAWAKASPHVKMAIKNPKNYILEGPGGGGRIIQIRNKKTGSVILG